MNPLPPFALSTELSYSVIMISAYAIVAPNSHDRRKKTQALFEKFNFNVDVNPDLLLIKNLEGKNSISIDQIKGIFSFLQNSPIQNPHKLILLEDAHLMTVEAQNAILKVLEEPPVFSTFIFEIPHSTSVLPTVLSRCAVIHITNTALDVEISTEHLEAFQKLLKGDVGFRLDWVSLLKENLKDKDFIANLLTGWETLIRDVLVLRSGSSNQVINQLNFQVIKSLSAESEYNEKFLIEILKKIQKALILIKNTNVSSQLLIEELLINL